MKEIKTVDIDIFKSNGWDVWNKNFCRYYDIDGNTHYCKTTDPIIKERNLMAWTKGKTIIKSNTGNIWINVEDRTDDMISVMKNTVVLKDTTGEYKRFNINDPIIEELDLHGPNKGRKGLFNHLNEKKYKCDWCDVITTKGNIIRWHNDNCKYKKS